MKHTSQMNIKENAKFRMNNEFIEMLLKNNSSGKIINKSVILVIYVKPY